jgi:hypothetical protein
LPSATYNGIALRYACDVARCLARAGLDLPVCIGGRLNQVPDDSNSGLPIDVTSEIRALGLIPCASLDDLAPLLRRLAEASSPDTPIDDEEKDAFVDASDWSTPV